MRWRDTGIIISARAHGEKHAIADLFTRAHGRWRGLVHGGAARGKRAMLQPGNIVQAEWHARLEDQLGGWKLEPRWQAAPFIMGDAPALAVLESLTAGLALCPERAAYPALFEGAETLLRHLDDAMVAAALLARFELRLLAELGYGLDLSACALTGEKRDLAWVSPKTGRAATRAAGAPWAEKLLPLPAFLINSAAAPELSDIIDALRLTGHFLRQRLFMPRGLEMPQGRARLPRLLEQEGTR